MKVYFHCFFVFLEEYLVEFLTSGFSNDIKFYSIKKDFNVSFHIYFVNSGFINSSFFRFQFELLVIYAYTFL